MNVPYDIMIIAENRSPWALGGSWNQQPAKRARHRASQRPHSPDVGRNANFNFKDRKLSQIHNNFKGCKQIWKFNFKNRKPISARAAVRRRLPRPCARAYD